MSGNNSPVRGMGRRNKDVAAIPVPPRASAPALKKNRNNSRREKPLLRDERCRFIASI
jgi:hypothetical protein